MPRMSNAERSRRYRERHPERATASAKKWRDANKEYNSVRQRQYQIKLKYGMTLEDYEVMFAEQGGVCKICGTDNPHNRWRVFAVDHCHDTGKIRGLLCNKCNRGMGLLDDNPDRLLAAANYLLSHKNITQEEKKKKKEIQTNV